jgi:ankyrin repeat protein
MFLNRRGFSKFIGLFFTIALICVLNCTDGSGAKIMNIKDFYSDSQMLSLIKAAENNDRDKLNQLVNAGVDPNTFGKEGMTPLFWLLGHQNKKAMKALLAAGADPNLKNSEGDSPMYLASGAEDTELMKILLDKGGDPTIKNDVGEPALFAAIRQKSTENVKILIDYGADINATDRTSTTPVMYAAILNQYHIVHFLLEKGADHKHLADGNISLASYVQDGKVNPRLEAYNWRKKVIKMLEERGVNFPVP